MNLSQSGQHGGQPRMQQSGRPDPQISTQQTATTAASDGGGA